MKIQRKIDSDTAAKHGSSPSANPPAWWKDPALWLITGLSALLLFWHLGGRCLWQDEAETALLGRSILRTGLPYAWDGRNLISQEISREFGDDHLWRWSPWIQFYLAAGSMKLFGETEVGARLLFVFIGLLTVPLVYLAALRMFASRTAGLLSALFLAMSVPFLLHARQARWHTPAYFLVVCLLLALLGMSRKNKWAPLAFVTSAILLWYTNFYVALGFVFSLTVAAPLLRLDWRFLFRLAISLAVVGVFVFPSYFFFLSFKSHDNNEAAKWYLQLVEYGGEFFTFFLPMPVLAILIYRLAKRSPAVELGEDWKSKIGFLLMVCLVYLVYLSVGPWRMFRYGTPLIPIASILLGVGATVVARNQVARAAVVVLLLLTNIFHKIPLGYVTFVFKTPRGEVVEPLPGTIFPSVDFETGWPPPKVMSREGMKVYDYTVGFPTLSVNSLFLAYLREIREPIEDTELAVAKYLNKHAKPDDVVLVSYGDLPLKFYTRLKIRGGLDGQPIPEDPDWMLPRHRIISKNRDGLIMDFMKKKVTPDRWTLMPVHGSDVVAANCPEPRFHCFSIPAQYAEPIKLFKKKEFGGQHPAPAK